MIAPLISRERQVKAPCRACRGPRVSDRTTWIRGVLRSLRRLRIRDRRRQLV